MNDALTNGLRAAPANVASGESNSSPAAATMPPATPVAAAFLRCPDCDGRLDANPYYPGCYFPCAGCASDMDSDAPLSMRAMAFEAGR